MFGNFNFADIGKHADELKALVTGLLNSTQETGEKASRALDTVLEAVGHLQTLMGIVSALQGQVSSLSKQVASLDPKTPTPEDAQMLDPKTPTPEDAGSHRQ